MAPVQALNAVDLDGRGAVAPDVCAHGDQAFGQVLLLLREWLLFAESSSYIPRTLTDNISLII